MLAVMTVFRPGAEAARNAFSIAQQVDELVVVDDGSGPESSATLADIVASGANVIRLTENSGIAAATNAGIAQVEPRGGDLVVFFDQDSAVPPGFVSALRGAIATAGRRGVPVGGAAPEHFAGVRQGRTDRNGLLRVDMPIQSGLMVTADTLARVGGMRDELFIDLVDDDFALRVADAGRVIVGAADIRLPHQLGQQVAVPFFGRPLGMRGRPLAFTVSAPFRYYYRARNRVLVSRAHRRRHRMRLAVDTLVEARHYAIVLAAVKQRGALLALLRAGRRDGRRGVGGRIPAALQHAAGGIDWRFPL